MEVRTHRSIRCTAHTRSGEPCGRWSIVGGRVCPSHGGAAPQVKRKAEDLMRELVEPAIASLERQIRADEFNAARYVLDWAGFRASPERDVDVTAVQVTVNFDRSEPHE